ncbi:receptor-like protein kinase, partial [Trifolium pratense]
MDNPRPVRWEKPGVGWIKCNVDVVFVVGSGVTSIVEGEALALLHAMKEAIHRGFERVQFESDSKLLVDAIHSRR